MEIAIVVLALAGAWWYSGTLAREVAIRTARDACQRHGLQLLDETVALDTVRPRRDRSGRVRLWRRFQFEFTDDGQQRRNGVLELLGKRVQRVHLEFDEGRLFDEGAG